MEKTKKKKQSRMGRIWWGRRTERGLTCALFQLDTAAHVDVVDSDVPSGRMIKKTLKHHLRYGTKHEDCY